MVLWLYPYCGNGIADSIEDFLIASMTSKEKVRTGWAKLTLSRIPIGSSSNRGSGMVKFPVDSLKWLIFELTCLADAARAIREQE